MRPLGTTAQSSAKHKDEPKTAAVLYYVLTYDNLATCQTHLAAALSGDGQSALIGRTHEEEPPRLVFPSSGPSSFTVGDRFLSRTHARILFHEGAVYVEDLGSTHGTFVWGERVAGARRLEDGDVLEMGHSMFVFRTIGHAHGLKAVSMMSKGFPFGPTRTFCQDLVAHVQDLWQVARTQQPVLILGETGTGKELAAQYVHAQSGARGALVPVDCGAIPKGLVESTLFGHVRGAYTGATEARQGRIRAAQGGTLFLDEIGNLPEEAQAVLLRVMQEQKVTPVGSDRAEPVEVRYVAATNTDVFAPESRFRADLRVRLSGYVLRLPRLSERREDLGVLSAHFLAEAGVKHASITERAARKLFGGPLESNIRGLRFALQTACHLAKGEPIDIPHLGEHIAERRSAPREEPTPSMPQQQAEPVQALQEKTKGGRRKRPSREVLEAALEKAGGKQVDAARLLGVVDRQLVRWMDAYGMARARKGPKEE